MSMTSQLQSRLGLKLPVIQGPFGGGLSTVALTAAVSNAGALGSFGAHQLRAEELSTTISAIRAATRGPFAINLWVPKEDATPADPVPATFEDGLRRFAALYRELGIALPEPSEVPSPIPFAEQVDALLEGRPPVFSFVFGIPAPSILEACRSRGILTVGAATTVDEARALSHAGVDAIVASGSDAGGHRPSFLRPAEQSLVGTMALVPQVADAVECPVIAAGGIADGRGVAAALALGADTAQIGTAFLACAESGIHPSHRELLLSGRSHWTMLSRAFSGRLARYVRTDYLARCERDGLQPVRYPLQAVFSRPIALLGQARSDPDYIPAYAGQAASLIRHRHAADLLDALAAHFS